MTIAVTVAVGLGAAILGAVASFLGLVHIENRRIRRTQLGMLRALLSEIRENAAAVIVGRRLGGSVDFSSETWQGAKVELAEFLDAKLYEEILVLYVGLPQMKAIAARGIGIADSEAAQSWLRLSVRITEALNLKLPENLRLSIGEPESLELK